MLLRDGRVTLYRIFPLGRFHIQLDRSNQHANVQDVSATQYDENREKEIVALEGAGQDGV